MPSVVFSSFANVGSQVYSQWGEEGIILEIIAHLELEPTCCEFGAADGLFCSNTALLWRKYGYRAHLFEMDAGLFEKLLINTSGFDVSVKNLMVEDIDSLVPNPVSIMSKDVDGEELNLLSKMEVVHDVLIVEHNPTFPPHALFSGGNGVGSSILSIIKEAEKKGYFFLTATKSNTFLIHNRHFSKFEKYDRDLFRNFDASCLNYVVTDYHGNYDILGQLPYGMLAKVDFDVR